MAIYKTKPFEIEAMLFDGENFKEIQEFVGSREVEPGHEIINFQPAGSYGLWLNRDGSKDKEIVAEVYDKLHSTWVGVRAGQYIIKGMKGEFYPCDAGVFEAKYELKYDFTN